MNPLFRILFPLVTALALGTAAHAEDAPAQEQNPIASLDWHKGPATEDIAAKATIHTDADLSFLDEANSKRFLELTGNIPEDGNYIIASESAQWWATFAFDPVGYVKDDEKIDADELLATLKSGDAPSNEYRRSLGLGELHTVGWVVPPHYDAQTRRLEWGLKVRSGSGESVNYTVRLLGRTGVMNATLVADPQTLDKDIPLFKASLGGFAFKPGETYAEYKEGDRVAEYGLAALVVGGAAAVAAKTGFLAKFWKLIVLGAGALVAAVGRLFGRKKKA
ncbi:MAG: DUF2167 domain-containing protein [Xanthomonadales bacterium]|nr:DUF2167 domain-containing protein [Xanthomonadales bacterium]